MQDFGQEISSHRLARYAQSHSLMKNWCVCRLVQKLSWLRLSMSSVSTGQPSAVLLKLIWLASWQMPMSKSGGLKPKLRRLLLPSRATRNRYIFLCSLSFFYWSGHTLICMFALVLCSYHQSELYQNGSTALIVHMRLSGVTHDVRSRLGTLSWHEVETCRFCSCIHVAMFCIEGMSRQRNCVKTVHMSGSFWSNQALPAALGVLAIPFCYTDATVPSNTVILHMTALTH